MRVGVHTVDRRFLATHTTPPVRIADKEELLLREKVQAWKVFIRGLDLSSLPCLESSRETSCIGNVLPKGQTSIDVQRLSISPFNGEIGVLLDKALGLVRERVDRLVRPPISVVTILVVVSAGGVKGV